MATPTLTEYLNSLYTTTWAKRRPKDVDQIFETNVLLKLLNSKGMIKYESTDGRRVEIPLRVKKTLTTKFFGKGATFTITDYDPLTVAYDMWKNVGDQIIRYWEDDKVNGGSETAHLKLMNSKLDGTRDSMAQFIEQALWSNVGGSSTLNYNGIPYLINVSPTTSQLIHGIDQSTAVSNDGIYYWQNQVKNHSGSFSITGESDMTNLMNTCNRWGKVDVLISDQATEELGEAEAIERVRVVNKEAVDLGIDHITFKGRIWVWSPLCTVGYTYFIDREHLGFSIDPQVNMTMGPWKMIPNQYMDVVTQIVQRGQVWRDKAQCHGLLYGQTA